jgi:hypothetical protein
MTTDELKAELKARFIKARDAGAPATIGLTEVIQLLNNLTLDGLDAAVSLVLDDLTDNNAHTIAAMVESYYRTGYDADKVERAYKAAQWELFGTR